MACGLSGYTDAVEDHAGRVQVSEGTTLGSSCHAPISPVGVSHRLVTMALMSELPAEDTHDVIHRGGQVVAVVVPIEEYRQLRLALEEQQVNEEFDAARASYRARQAAGAVQYVSHEEARLRLGLPGR